MDLGIAGKRAIICGASKGLGKACAEALAREGVKITIAARHLAQLAETAEEIRKVTGIRVTSVVAVEPCLVQVTPRSQLARLVQSRPQVGIRLAQRLARRVAELDTAPGRTLEARRKGML